METFSTKKVIDYGENEIMYQPAHTDVTLLKVEDATKKEYPVKLTLEVTSTIGSKTGRAQTYLTREDLVKLILSSINLLK